MKTNDEIYVELNDLITQQFIKIEDAEAKLKALADKQPDGYITHESWARLRGGGNGSRSTVPLHAYKSSVARIPVYFGEDE